MGHGRELCSGGLHLLSLGLIHEQRSVLSECIYQVLGLLLVAAVIAFKRVSGPR